MPSTPRQRAAELAHASHEKKSAESAHRLQQTNDAKKKNWHEKRNGKFLSGARRQREDAAVEEEGGASKLQGIGSPPRGGGLGIKNRVGTPKSILWNKAGNSASSSGGMSSCSNDGNQDKHFNRDSRGTNGASVLAHANHEKKISQKRTPPSANQQCQKEKLA